MSQLSRNWHKREIKIGTSMNFCLVERVRLVAQACFLGPDSERFTSLGYITINQQIKQRMKRNRNQARTAYQHGGECRRRSPLQCTTSSQVERSNLTLSLLQDRTNTLSPGTVSEQRKTRNNNAVVFDSPPKNKFEALANALSKIHNSLQPCWYQIVFGDKKKVYEGIGTLDVLLTLNQINFLNLMRATGLIATRNGKILLVKEKPFQELKIMISDDPGFDFVLHNGREGNAFIRLGKSHSKPIGIFQQLKEQSKPPQIESLSSILNEFKCYPFIEETIFSENPTTIHSREEEDTNDEAAGSRQCSILYDDDLFATTKKKRKYTRKRRTAMVNGQPFLAPNDCKFATKSSLRLSEEARSQASKIRQAANKLQCNLAEVMKLFVGTMAANYVQASDTIMEQVMACGSLVLAHQFGLSSIEDDDCTVTFDQVTQIMPKPSSVNTYVLQVAAHKIVLLGHRMIHAKNIFLGVDKGAKVLVKKAYLFNRLSGEIEAANLDFNKSADDAQGRGEAMKKSLEKYMFGENRDDEMAGMIGGGATDSGGSFTLEAMNNEECFDPAKFGFS
jgi:hypothetical protein